jgi:hypothetical protein
LSLYLHELTVISVLSPIYFIISERNIIKCKDAPVIKQCSMKAYGRCEDKAPHIPDLGTRWK